MKMAFLKKFAVALVLAAVAAGHAAAQKQTPPAGGPAKPFVFPKEETYTLDNGMKVTLLPYGSIPKVAIQAIVRAGSINEKAEQRWVSDVVAMILKEGTAKRTAADLARDAAEMGGSIFSSAGTDKTVVGGEVLSEFDSKLIEVIGEILRSPKFEADDFETIKANKLREITISRGQASTLAWEKFRQTLFPGHAYADPYPKESVLNKMTLADAKSYYDSQYGAARTHLYIVGQFDRSRVKKAVEAAYADWKKGPEMIRDVPESNAKRTLSVIDRPGAPQSTIYIGMPAISPSADDYVKFEVMDALLGGSFGSRITSNIREDKGYTYSPGSAIWSRYKVGVWYENADVTTEATGASIKEILFEIDRLKKEKPSEQEMTGTKNYLIGVYVLQNSSRAGVLNMLETVNYNELERSFLDKYVQMVSAVTAQDVSDMAKKYLDTNKMTIVVVGDRSKIDEQLKPYQP